MSVADIEPRVELALTNAFNNLGAYLRAVLEEFEVKDGLIVRDAMNLQRLDRTLRIIRPQLDALGYKAAVQTQLEGLMRLRDEAAAALDDSDEFDEAYVVESKAAIDLLLRGAETELVQIADKATAELSTLLRQSVLGAGDYAGVLNAIQKRMDNNRHQATTLARTTLFAFNSMVTVQEAEADGVDWYWYRGPKDGVLRPWCSYFVDTRVTLEILEKHAGGVGEAKRDSSMVPVPVWRGGWNCRHELVPIEDPDDLKRYKVGPRKNPIGGKKAKPQKKGGK